jgi:hypothetical protein
MIRDKMEEPPLYNTTYDQEEMANRTNAKYTKEHRRNTQAKLVRGRYPSNTQRLPKNNKNIKN